MNTIDKIIEKIDKAQKIAIFCHENPDGDAIWSMLWFWKLLEKQWKNVNYFSPNQASKTFEFLRWFENIKDKFDYGYYHLIIFLDFSDYSRLWKIIEDKQEYFDQQDIITIDHHEWSTNPSNRTMLKDTNATSTCEIIFENTINIREKYYDKDIATYMYLWLTTDSWNFRYDKNHERILKNALDLIKLWADKDLIIDNMINNKTIWTMKFLKLLLDRLAEDGNILYTYYKTNELKEYMIDSEQASYGLTIIQEIDWPKVIMTLRKEWDKIKWSLRSKNTDVEKIAKHFGGWWHTLAAWFSTKIDKNFDNTKTKIIKEINDLL